MIRYTQEFNQSLVEMHNQGRSYTALMSRLWAGFCVKANVIMVIIAKDFGTISFGVSLTKAEAE